MPRRLPFILLFALLAACLPPAAPATPPAPAAATAAPVVSPTADPTGTFTVQAWVDHPEPGPGERVTVRGSLIKNGVYLGGMMMRARWPDETHDPGRPNCVVVVIYQTGVCTLETGDFPPGVYVPVTVAFDYRGKTYTGATGFTPR